MTEPVRVHMRVPGTAPLPELMALVQRIEAAGFEQGLAPGCRVERLLRHHVHASALCRSKVLPVPK